MTIQVGQGFILKSIEVYYLGKRGFHLFFRIKALTKSAHLLFVLFSEYVCHVYVDSNNVGGVVIADQEYPQRVAHTLLNKVLEDFQSKVEKKVWTIAKEE